MERVLIEVVGPLDHGQDGGDYLDDGEEKEDGAGETAGEGDGAGGGGGGSSVGGCTPGGGGSDSLSSEAKDGGVRTEDRAKCGEEKGGGSQSVATAESKGVQGVGAGGSGGGVQGAAMVKDRQGGGGAIKSTPDGDGEQAGDILSEVRRKTALRTTLSFSASGLRFYHSFLLRFLRGGGGVLNLCIAVVI